ncbi:MAG TPA: Uma2 family endonuclease, partial [Phormidium sp.]
KTDDTAKEFEYARVKVPEYWIVDLRQSKISVFLLMGDSYQAIEYKGSQAIISQVFQELMLPVERVLNA